MSQKQPVDRFTEDDDCLPWDYPSYEEEPQMRSIPFPLPELPPSSLDVPDKDLIWYANDDFRNYSPVDAHFLGRAENVYSSSTSSPGHQNASQTALVRVIPPSPMQWQGESNTTNYSVPSHEMSGSQTPDMSCSSLSTDESYCRPLTVSPAEIFRHLLPPDAIIVDHQEQPLEPEAIIVDHQEEVMEPAANTPSPVGSDVLSNRLPALVELSDEPLAFEELSYQSEDEQPIAITPFAADRSEMDDPQALTIDDAERCMELARGRQRRRREIQDNEDPSYESAEDTESESGSDCYKPSTSTHVSRVNKKTPKRSQGRKASAKTPRNPATRVKKAASLGPMKVIFCGPRHCDATGSSITDDTEGEFIFASYPHSDLLLEALHTLGFTDNALQTPARGNMRCQFDRQCSYGQIHNASKFAVHHYRDRHVHRYLNGVGYFTLCPLCGGSTSRGDNASRHLGACGQLRKVSDCKSRAALRALRQSYIDNLFLRVPLTEEVQMIVDRQEQDGTSAGKSLQDVEDAIREEKEKEKEKEKRNRNPESRAGPSKATQGKRRRRS